MEDSKARTDQFNKAVGSFQISAQNFSFGYAFPIKNPEFAKGLDNLKKYPQNVQEGF